ncbi:MAG: transposase [Phycisphaeraceae bacterium]
MQTKRSIAHAAHDQTKRRRAKQALKYPPVVFDGRQALAVTQGFADYVEKNGRVVFACAVMPDHAHLVVARCDRRVETIAEQLKARATSFLNKQRLHPFADRARPDGRAPTPWARGCWSVFLSSDESIARAIQYVEQNPVKAGYKSQRYAWVKPFKG